MEVSIYSKRTKVYVTAKYPCTDCAIYRLNPAYLKKKKKPAYFNSQLGSQLITKMGIEICWDQKFIVLALNMVKFLIF